MPAGHSLIRSARARRLGALLAGGLTALSARACTPPLPSDVPVAPPPEGDADAAIVLTAEASRATDAGDAADTDASQSDADDAGEAGDAELAVRPEPQLVIEKPYQTWARPRPKGEVAAGAHDELVARWNLGGTSSPEFPSSRPSFHPGTRVKVDTRVVSGRLPKTAPVDRRTGKHAVVLSETSLLARARKHGYWPYRLCFERGVQQRGKLDGGETLLSFAVDARGRVGSLRVVRSKLDVPDVVSCLGDETRDLPLLPPPRRVQVELAVQVWPGDAPLPALPPAPTDPALLLPLDADALEQALEAERGAFAACYAEGLARDAGLWGRLQLHIESDPAGSVKRAKQAESRFPDAQVVACVLRQLKEVRLPGRAGKASSFEIALRMGREPDRPSAATP